ncbi:MAG TPA: J domain-containing protein [Gaiellaceae bacterium]|nr:J domain-containing protein [Gaiellaceae bacterium]
MITAPPKTLYDVLGVARDATPEEIKAGYRRAVREVHPDNNDGPDAAERTIEVTAAYEILSDPEKRADYDARLARGTDHPGLALPCPRCSHVYRYHLDLNEECSGFCCTSCRETFLVRLVGVSAWDEERIGAGRARYTIDGTDFDGYQRSVEFDGPTGIRFADQDVAILIYRSDGSPADLVISNGRGRLWDLRPERGTVTPPSPPPAAAQRPPRPTAHTTLDDALPSTQMIVGAWRQVHFGRVLLGIAGWWLLRHYLQPFTGGPLLWGALTIAAGVMAKSKHRRIWAWMLAAFFTDGMFAIVLALMPSRVSGEDHPS